MKKVHAELGPGAVIVSSRVLPDPQYPDHPFYEVIARAPSQGTMMAIQSLRSGQSGSPTPPPSRPQRVAGGALRSVQPGQEPATTARQRGQVPPTTVRSREDSAPQPEASKESSSVGGLEKQLAAIREVVVLPIEYPEMFERLGIDAPKGVLMHGPPGCGKTLIARTLAKECGATFLTINGPELLGSGMGESEENLRKAFEEANEKAPSVIFLDEIDAIAGDRSDSSSGTEKRLVTQLLTLMDGMEAGRKIIILAATNLPDSLDPALRRPGRFDREVEIEPPDEQGRLEILKIHTQKARFGSDVNLKSIADQTHGYVGADLASLCKEAGLAAIREASPGGRMPRGGMANLKIYARHFEEALKAVQPSMMREGQANKSQVTWDDIGGLEEVKKELHESIVMPLREPEMFERMGIRPSKGVLLTGPPGTGKTLIAKAAAHECGVNFIAVNGPSLVSKFVGESEKGIRDVFERARKVSPCIIFFDEMDSVAPVRSQSDGEGHADRMVAQLLVEMDGFGKENEGIFCLAATNRADAIDPAILRPGRFDKVIEVPLPDETSRRKILQVHFKGKALEPNVSFEEVLKVTAGLSGAEIGEAVRRAAMNAVRNAYSGQGRVEPTISQADLIQAFQEVRKAAGKEEVKDEGGHAVSVPTQPRALVLDDEFMPREVAVAALSRAGFEVEDFRNSDDAIAAIKSSHFDLVFLDDELPSKSGPEVLAEIREISPNLPVIMALGSGDPNFAVTSFRMGVIDFLNKPYEVGDLLSAAKKAVGALHE